MFWVQLFLLTVYFSVGIRRKVRRFWSCCPRRKKAWLHSFKRKKFPLTKSSECSSFSCVIAQWKWDGLWKCLVLYVKCGLFLLWMLVHQHYAETECVVFVKNGGSHVHAENKIWQLNSCDHYDQWYLLREWNCSLHRPDFMFAISSYCNWVSEISICVLYMIYLYSFTYILLSDTV